MRYPTQKQIRFAKEYEIKSGYRFDASKHNFMALPACLTLCMGIFPINFIFKAYITSAVCIAFGITIIIFAIVFRKSAYLRQWNVISAALCYGVVAPIFFTSVFTIATGYLKKSFFPVTIILILINFLIGIVYTKYKIQRFVPHTSNIDDKKRKTLIEVSVFTTIAAGSLLASFLGGIDVKFAAFVLGVILYIGSLVFLTRFVMAVAQIIILKKIDKTC